MTAPLAPGRVAAASAAFVVAYFLAAWLRAVTATLAPTFSAEFALGAADLGLLAGAYFLGFSLLQLPLGAALDRHGPRRVQLVLLGLAVAGCATFALAQGLPTLVAARALIGMGVAGCLMAPLTFFRHHLSAQAQLRAHSWMLMTGSFGMMASTLPVQLMLDHMGWRSLFGGLALALLGVTLATALALPRPAAPATAAAANAAPPAGGYAAVWRHPLFRRTAPMALLCYGGLIAMQTLWIGPWLTQVAGQSPAQASRGLLLVNGCMLLAFLGWGWLTPVLARRGVSPWRVVSLALPLNLALLAVVLLAGARAGAALWALWCVSLSAVALSQPALAQAFELRMAGRALSAFNLLIFVGVFLVQWGLGAGIDALRAAGAGADAAFRLTLAAYGLLCIGAWRWFARGGPDNAPSPASP